MAIPAKKEILKKLKECLTDSDAASLLQQFAGSIHLAILQEPYLSYILQGVKTIESRFAKVGCAPFNQVAAGDIILLKQSGGEIKALCKAEKVWFFTINQSTLKEIRLKFGKEIHPEEPKSFWQARKYCKVATLIKLADIITISGMEIKKKDRRGWIILK